MPNSREIQQKLLRCYRTRVVTSVLVKENTSLFAIVSQRIMAIYLAVHTPGRAGCEDIGEPAIWVRCEEAEGQH